MKIGKRILLALPLLLFILSQTLAPPASAAPQGKKSVRVYFWRERDSTSANPLGVSAVTRSVSAASPARGALEALLDGPTAAEESQGYLSLNVQELDIGLLSIKGGTARVNFVASRTWAGWPGDLAPGRFKEAVTRTLKQFPNVRRVIVSVNGDTKFDSGEG